MTNPKLVTVSGIDGSGKSTQVELLKTYFQKSGKKIYHFHCVQFSIGNRILKKFAGNRMKNGEKPVTKASFSKIMLRRLALLIDIFRFRRILKNLDKDIVLSDRYFFDSLVNISYLAKSDKRLFCERFVPKPHISFYLNANPQKIMCRKRVPEQGIEYLVEKKKIFDSNYRRWGMIPIDADNEINAINKKLLQIIHKEIK